MLKRFTTGFSTLQQYVYVICLIIFAVHQVLQQGFDYYFPIADDWLDVLLFPLLLMPLILAEQRFILKDPEYFFPSILLIGYCIMLAILSEYLFPALSTRFVRDPVDVGMILTGTILFYFIYRK